MPYRRVVVGTDGSETAQRAVRHAARLASGVDAELVVVTAFAGESPDTERARAEAPDDVRWMITGVHEAEERAGRGRALAAAEGVARVRVRAERGDPADVILDVADDVGADLIVVGNKGMASPARFLLGNVPNKVSHHTPCDVLIVRTVD